MNYCVIEENQPSVSEALNKHVDKRFVSDLEKYNLKSGIAHKSGKIGEETVNRLCLSSSLQQDIFLAYQGNLEHQGKERTLSLLLAGYGQRCPKYDIPMWALHTT